MEIDDHVKAFIGIIAFLLDQSFCFCFFPSPPFAISSRVVKFDSAYVIHMDVNLGPIVSIVDFFI